MDPHFETMSQSEDLRKVFYHTNTIASPADIVSALVPLIQDSTTVTFPRTLIKYVGKIANERPRDTATICKALSTLLNNSEIRNKQLAAPAYGSNFSMTFNRAFSLFLAEEISDGLDDVYSEEENGNLSIDSTNIRLTAALLSASMIKHNLQSVSERVPLHIMSLGLQDPDPSVGSEPEKNEVFGVVAMIHIAIVGDRIRETMKLNFSGDVTQALKSLKDKGVFKSPSSVKLLEVRLIYVTIP